MSKIKVGLEDSKHRAFVAFSGGGAKGIVHVGALKALEERKVTFLGISGTSAGAIVAALVASGFRSEDLVDVEKRTTIIDQLCAIDPKLRRATNLFGDDWRKIILLRIASRQQLPLLLILVVVWGLPLALIVLVSIEIPSRAWLWILIGWSAMGALLVVTYRSLIGGLASARSFRDALGVLLQQKIFPNEPERIVVMSDFGVDGRPPLKIVSANLTTRSLHLFSAHRTPSTAVADAVAASICLPVIFRPWQIDQDFHVDGGIVSNLPAWPFDEERELDPGALTVAVEIKAQSNHRKLGRFSWMSAAIPTALFGSGELNLRIAGHAEQLALPTKFDLLDFDKGIGEVVQEVKNAAIAAGARLDKRLFRLPEIYQNACQVAQALALDGLGVDPGGRGAAPRIRVAVGRLERGYVQSLRLSHSVGFDEDTDESMLVPLSGSLAGFAWHHRQSTLERYPLHPDLDLPGEANDMRRRCRWPAAKWVMYIPIFDEERNEPRLLVHLDGNMELLPNLEQGAALEGVEAAVRDFFNLVFHELRELENYNGAH